MKSPPETFPCKISWSLIQLLSLTSSALWMSLKKKGRQGKKTSQCDWRRKKTFSNYSTRSPASLNLSVWWLHGFFFFTPLNGFLCCQPFQRDLPHLPHNPLTFIKYICGGIAVWASKSLSIPHICTSAAAADSWHHNSLCLCRKKGCKGPRRSSRHISLSRPVSEIISGTDKLPGSYFYFFFIRLSCMKQADVTDTLILVSGHVYRSPRSLREVTLPPSVSVPRVYPRPLLILSHSSLSAASR